MSAQRRNWTYEETLMAFTLYYLLPPKEVDKSGADVKNLAQAIGRTPSAVALKAWNIAANDPNRVATGRVGMRNGSKLDVQIWEEYARRGNSLVEEGINLLSKTLEGMSVTSAVSYAFVDLAPEGKERSAVRMERVNQQYFRNSLIRNYEGRCCLTGLSTPPLLVASHIKPWSVCDPRTERLVASNGLLLNALHDRAFDKGLITLNRNLEVIISSKLQRDSAATDLLYKYEGRKIEHPISMPPAREFIEYHNDVVFVA